MARPADRDSLLALLGPVVSERGLDLEDVVVTPAGQAGGCCAWSSTGTAGSSSTRWPQVSTAVSRVLDESDAMGGDAVRPRGDLAGRRPAAHRAPALAAQPDAVSSP